MRHIIRASLLCFIPFYITACFSVEHACDVCIYGGTSAGVIAARSIAAQGKSVVIVEPSGHLGGMTSGGLGQTDIGKRQVLTGLAGEFYRDIGARYGAGEKLVFEPHVASVVFAGYLDNPHILVLKNQAGFCGEFQMERSPIPEREIHSSMLYIREGRRMISD